MASVLPGFEYDIFVSYRHKDNKGDQWVTGFVNALRTELESTFKEDISIYFDSNATDGLLENHLVNKSLEGKLRCLIFIPIISQTYCDAKSFAWQHELCAFNILAKTDRFGVAINVANGNVASRILPVRISEPDPEDKLMLEAELGSVLRSVDFIYQEPGVKRPLKPGDNRSINLNKTDYANQVNKVANAIKEIISGLKQPAVSDSPRSHSMRDPLPRTVSVKFIILAVAIALFAAVAYLLYSKLRSSPAAITTEKSIAVLPFADLSETRDQEWFSDGLTEELLNSLANLRELRVIARTSSFAFKGRNIPIEKIADSLHVAYLVEGSVRKYEKKLRITAQLIRASDGSHIWSQTYDRPATDIFTIQKDISQNITRALDIYLDDKKRETMFGFGTQNVEAYEYLLKGKSVSAMAHLDRRGAAGNGVNGIQLGPANIWFEKAIALDPEFAAPYYLHHDLYAHFLMDAVRSDNDKLSVKEANTLMMSDLNHAIQYARQPAEKLQYQINHDFLSENWANIPSLLESLDSNDEAVQSSVFQQSGWTLEIILALDRVAQGSKLLRYSIQKDPLDARTILFSAFFLFASNKSDSALNLLQNALRKTPESSFLKLGKIGALTRTGNHEEAKNELNKLNLSADNSFRLLTTVYGADAEKRKRILKIVKAKKINSLDDAQLYTLLGMQRKADSIAHEIDSRLLGPQIIVDYQFGNGGDLPFDLSVTPNFATRLREAGIDLKKYEARHRQKSQSGSGL